LSDQAKEEMKERNILVLVIIGLVAAGGRSSGQSLDKARACFLKGDWKGQANELQVYLVAHPKDIEALVDQGYALSRLKRYPEAINTYSTIIRLCPNSSAGWKGRADSYFAVGKYLESLHDCDDALKLDPSQDELWTAHAEANEKLGNMASAIDDMTHAINSKYRTGFFGNLVYRAQLYRKLGKYELAIRDCSRVLALWPTDQSALAERANNYDMVGKHEQANDDREELSNVKAHTFSVGAPRNIIVDGKAGTVIAAGSSPEERSNQAKQQKVPPSVEQTPNTVPTALNQKEYYKLAKAYGWQRSDLTLECIKKIIAIDAKSELAVKANRMMDLVLPKHMPPAKEAVSLSKEAMNCISDHNRSRRLSENCVKRYPEFEYGYISLGALEKDVGNPSAARANFEKALRINPHNLEALSRLGDILRQIDEEQAKVVLRLAVELDPDDSFDRYVLYLLEGDDHQ
jgi:tetratricopeptide (TPR) repeat protein